MKTLLVALLVLTTAMSLAWRRHAQRPRTRIVLAPSRTTDPVDPRVSRAHHQPDSTATDGTSPSGTPSDPWAAVRAGDLPAFIRSLRASGCPDGTLHLFAIAAAGRSAADRVEAPLRDAVRTSVWWRLPPTAPWRVLPGTLRKARAQLDRDLIALVGQTAETMRREMAGMPARAADWLGPAQRTALDALNARHRDEIDDLVSEGPPDLLGSNLNDAQRARLRALRERQADEARVLLGSDAFSEYLMRDGPAADYVRRYLPEARTEAEFRQMVQAALDVGADPLDARSVAETRFIPADAFPDRPADPQERVLARFRELNSPEGNAAFDEARAAEQAREKAEQEARNEADMLADLATLARAGGTRITEDEARNLATALRRRGEELDREWGEPPKSATPAERAALHDRIARELEAVAVSVLGDRGRVLVEQMRLRQRP